PWFRYGWDFGPGPPTWRCKEEVPDWTQFIDDDLEELGTIGVSVVRWFVLGDGLTYGTGRDVPKQARPTNGSTSRWSFDPPALTTQFLDDFESLLKKFAKTSTGPHPIRILPVFVDFLFCDAAAPVGRADSKVKQSVREPRWLKGGRAEALTTHRLQFIQQAL